MASIAFNYSSPEFAYKGIGWSQYNFRRYDEARSYFEKGIKLNPDLGDAYNGLGWADIQSDNCQRAIANLQIALQFDPELAKAKSGLTLCESSQMSTATPVPSPTPPLPEPIIAKVVEKTVNVRDGSSLSSRIIGKVRENDQLVLLAHSANGEWYQAKITALLILD